MNERHSWGVSLSFLTYVSMYVYIIWASSSPPSREWWGYNKENFLFFHRPDASSSLDLELWAHPIFQPVWKEVRDTALHLSFLNPKRANATQWARGIPWAFLWWKIQSPECLLSHESSARMTVGKITGLPQANVLKKCGAPVLVQLSSDVCSLPVIMV